MKKRICSLLLICSMLAGLLPQIVLPQAAAADTAAARDGFGLPTEEKTGITDTATLRNNPYGTLGWVPLFQNHELVVAGVDSDEFQTTYEGAANGKGSKMSDVSVEQSRPKSAMPSVLRLWRLIRTAPARMNTLRIWYLIKVRHGFTCM